jgi:hypothetical protein
MHSRKLFPAPLQIIGKRATPRKGKVTAGLRFCRCKALILVLLSRTAAACPGLANESLATSRME